MHAAAVESLLPFLYPGAKILDIGSGSGYLTHVLSKLVGSEGEGNITGIDHIQGLVDLATNNMRKSEDGKEMLRNGTVKLVKGDGRKGWPEGGRRCFRAPACFFLPKNEEADCESPTAYDAIHVGAAATEAHSTLLDQLKSPGRSVSTATLNLAFLIDVRSDEECKQVVHSSWRYIFAIHLGY